MADDSVSRRQLLLSVGSVGSLAGCSTVLDGDGTDTADRTETTASTASVTSSPAVTPAGTRTDASGRESTAPNTRERPETTRQEPEPDIDVTETTISERILLTGETLELVVTVTNVGDAEGTADLAVGLDGADGTEAGVDVPPGETVQRTFSREMTEAGTFAVSLNGETIGEVTVEPREPAFDVTGSLLTESIRVEESIEVAIEVGNTGTADGEIELGLSVGGTGVGGETVAVPAGGMSSVEVSSSAITTTGTLPVTLNGETIGEVTVGPPEILHVTTDGAPDNLGTEGSPLGSIDDAVGRAGPGQTVQVHPGEYVEYVEFGIGGEPDAPITLTGPPDAVLRPPTDIDYQAVSVAASHVHITGLTITGLHDPDAPEDPDSYHSGKLVDLNSFPDGGDDYIEGLVISPHRIGNSGTAFINSQMIRDSEIGGFEVIGPAGANWILDDTSGHRGEMVYLGTAADNRVARGYEEYDRTRNVRVHHIDNNAGHPHSELVDCKGGVENITVEYCTDGGGAQTHQGPYSRAVSLDGHDCTVRWNDIRNVEGDGVRIGPQGFMGDPETLADPETELERRMGTEHAIYGNVFTGCVHEGINFLRESLQPGQDSNPLPEDQRALCDNVSDGYDDALDGICPSDLPAGNGVGHLGGDSPWEEDPPTKGEVFSRHGLARNLDTTVTADDVPTGAGIEAVVTLTNNGADTADVAVRLQVDIRFELDAETVSIPPGGTREVRLTDGGLPDPVAVLITRSGQKIGGLRVTDEN